MKIAIYTRVSTSMQFKDGYSLESQRTVLESYCKLKKWTIIGYYTDEGISAKNTRRPGFQQMLADAMAKRFDAILVWKLSRFSRSLKDLINVIDDLSKYNVTLISYSENIDLSSAVGKLMFNIIGSFAEFERETISENIKMSIEQAVYKGRRNVSHCFGYDVVEKQFVINHKEAKIVNDLFDNYLKTKNVAETTRYAQCKNYKGRRGKLLTYNSIHVILRNITYVGYSSYKNTIPYKHKVVPQIITETMFDKVQRLLKRNCSVFATRDNVKTVAQWLKT